ncbi:XdhC/CoxI family protein [uncultured Clostridium sp.]|uniref:XdhC/CoxI family protein n=1 Tax=uncultured Clostridium sp. TaxID=59620 RepID=UPI0025FCC95B|nr:XdhC/CoxI family protein [uncultured Clostridium sp.]
MDNQYRDLLYKLENEEDNIIVTTMLSKDGRGKISEFNRNLILNSSFKKDTENDNEFKKSANKKSMLSEDERLCVLEFGKPKCFEKNDTVIFAEPNFKRERIILFGGGHIAIPLVKIAKIAGFYTIVIDDRPSFANKARFKEADEVICDGFENCLERIHPTESDYFVIITRGHRHDKLCIEQLMKYKESVYTGMIGSKRRTKIVLENLEEEGYDKERLARICTPIGISIGAATTEEIAVSIMAEIIKRKRLESAENRLINRSDLEMEVIEKIAENKEPCCIVTIMESQGSVPRNSGAKMIVYRDGRIFGSIGGGCVEASVVCQAREMIGSGDYRVIPVDLNGEYAMAEGMVCGGTLKLLLEDAIID